MTIHWKKLLFATALPLLALGCGRDPVPEAMPADQVPATVENAFKSADPALQNSAKEAVTAIQSNDDGKALTDLQALFAQPDLTPEQRQALSRSMISLNEKLRKAAEQGDQRAAQALELYRARK